MHHAFWCSGWRHDRSLMAVDFSSPHMTLPLHTKSYGLNFSVFAVDTRCGDVNSHRGAPSRGLEWARFEAASATDPAGRRTVHFSTTLPFSKPTLRMTRTNLRHIRYLEVARIICIWSWLLLNLQLKEMV